MQEAIQRALQKLLSKGQDADTVDHFVNAEKPPTELQIHFEHETRFTVWDVSEEVEQPTKLATFDFAVTLTRVN